MFLRRGLLAAALLLIALPAAAAPVRRDGPDLTEVIVTLKAPPLADAPERTLAGRLGRRLNVASTVSRAYLARLDRAQDVLAARIVHTIPGATFRWRYHTVLDGMAVVLPTAKVKQLARVPGIAHVWPNAVYHTQLDRTPTLIGAPQVWGPGLATAGQGMKIAIIDEGVDQTHPFFNPAGFTYPPGFPKGNAAFTTPKVIVARVFPPPGATSPLETLPYAGAGTQDDHGTIVAGVAAGDANTLARGFRVSGIAPRAHLGNYKAMAAPTPAVGLDGNAPELAAAVEAAVNDGMNVISMSLGEPEIDPQRDAVVQALDAAANAGVVSVVAAGNDFTDFGKGSVSSPANAPKAIAVAASTGGHGSPAPDRIAAWSSGGPTPYSFQLKPDVTAPGVGILTSVPPGSWDVVDGTSLSTPHVAGAAALLMQRHPDWTVAQTKSALVTTGVPVHDGHGKEVPATREGGGRIDLPRADQPQIFVAPTSLSFRLVRPGTSVTRTLSVSNASGVGNLPVGPWTTSIDLQGPRRGVVFSVPSSVSAPATVGVGVRVARSAAERDVTGFVVLTRQGIVRRIPFWFRIERPRLALDRAHALTKPGVYRATTVGAASHVASYRYPDLVPNGFGFSTRLDGPEVVYRFRLRRPVANFGVAIVSRGPGVAVQPRIVHDADENRLAGYAGLPIDLNPYGTSLDFPRLVAGVVLPLPDTYDIVFDSRARDARGPFTFRFWVNDTTPPTVRMLTASHGVIRIAVRDGGAGVDPQSLHATVDGHKARVALVGGVARISGIGRGSHTLVFRASDYQETKNMEDVGPILPNTRTLKGTVVVR